MAHFAKLNYINVVIQTEVVADADTQDDNGNEVSGSSFVGRTLYGKGVFLFLEPEKVMSNPEVPVD